ncbi:hypothetical protein HDU98_010096 [Podochytrium sp. JEL0797]|nr:hypothetical protein HDU98_010096 [Podochytrium sp. JEL0797]
MPAQHGATSAAPQPEHPAHPEHPEHSPAMLRPPSVLLPREPNNTNTSNTNTNTNNSNTEGDHDDHFASDEDYDAEEEQSLHENDEDTNNDDGEDLLVVEASADEVAEEEVEEADRLLCGENAENATVKELQDAINVARPFGLKVWKPALYKKDRSIDAVTEAAIHEDPDDPSQKPISRFLNPGNLTWLLVFGWWFSLVYLAMAAVMFPFAAVGFLGLNALSRASAALGYMHVSPSQIRRQVETSTFSRGESRIFRALAVLFFELERFKEYVLPQQFPQASGSSSTTLESSSLLPNRPSVNININIPSDVESEYNEDTDSDYTTSDTDSDHSDTCDHGPNEPSSTRPRHSSRPSNIPAAAPTANRRTTTPAPSPGPRRHHQPPTSWTTKLRDAGVAGIGFRFLAFAVLAPMHLLCSLVCYLCVFSLPMGRLSWAVLTRVTRRRPLAVRACWGESRNAFGLVQNHDGGVVVPRATRKEYKIILCTNHAFGKRYYKYTFDGINIIILNLNAVVVFTLVDFYYIGPLTNHTGIGSYGVIFLSALFSVIPLAYMIGMAVSSITAQTGSLALGAVVNATFGSIVEILLYCLALMQGKTRMVEGSIIGSFMAGLLALPGVSMFFGGLTRKEQKFNTKAAGVTSTLLIMAILGAFGPTFFQGVYGTFEMQCVDCPVGGTGGGGGGSSSTMAFPLNCRQCRYRTPHPTEDVIYRDHTRPLMYICATVLILMYAIGLLFTLRTHSKTIYPSDVKKKRYRLSSIIRSERLPPTVYMNTPPNHPSMILPSPALGPHTLSNNQSATAGLAPPRIHMNAGGPIPKSPRTSSHTPSKRHSHPLSPLPPPSPSAQHFGLGITSGGGSSSNSHPAAFSSTFSSNRNNSNTTNTSNNNLTHRRPSQIVAPTRPPLLLSSNAAQFNNGSVVVDPALCRASYRHYSAGTDDSDSSLSSGTDDGAGMMDSMISVGSSAGAAAVVVGKGKGKGKAVVLMSGGLKPQGGSGEGGKKEGGHEAAAATGGHDSPEWGAEKSGMVLLLATLFFSMIAEVLIDCVDNVIDTGGSHGLVLVGGEVTGKWVIDEKILGLTLFALVPTVTEFYNAIAFARQGNIALSLEIGSAYTIQVALLQIPTLVAFSTFWRMYGTGAPPSLQDDAVAGLDAGSSKLPFWMFRQMWDAYRSGPNAFSMLDVPANRDTFTLIFPRWDVISVLFGVFIVTYLYIEGKSNYFKGSMLLFAYASPATSASANHSTPLHSEPKARSHEILGTATSDPSSIFQSNRLVNPPKRNSLQTSSQMSGVSGSGVAAAAANTLGTAQEARRASITNDRRKSLDVRLIQPHVSAGTNVINPPSPNVSNRAQSVNYKRETGGRNSLMATPPESSTDIPSKYIRQSEMSDINRGSVLKTAQSKNTIKQKTPPENSRYMMRTNSAVSSDKFYKTTSMSTSAASYRAMTEDMMKIRSEKLNPYTLSFVDPQLELEYEKFLISRVLYFWRVNLCIITSIIVAHYIYFIPNTDAGIVSTLQIILMAYCLTILKVRFTHAAITGIITSIIFYAMLGHLSNTNTVLNMPNSPLTFSSVSRNFVLVLLTTLVAIHNARETEQASRQNFSFMVEMQRANSKLTSQLKGLQKTFGNKVADFDSPLEKSVLILRSILADPNVNTNVLNMLDQVVLLLGSTNILTPDLENQLTDFMDNEQEAWLFSEIAPRKRVGGALRKAGPGGNRRRSSIVTGSTDTKKKDHAGELAAIQSSGREESTTMNTKTSNYVETAPITTVVEGSVANIVAMKNEQRSVKGVIRTVSGNGVGPKHSVFPAGLGVGGVGGPDMNFDQFNEIVTSPQMASTIANVDTYNWKIFEFVDASENHPLCVLTGYLFERSDLFSHFDIPHEKFWKFVATVEAAYHSDLPFHNAAHATDVLHCIAHLAQLDTINCIIGESELLCIYLAAIIHDVDHPGVNNNFLSTTYDERAILYNDKSILENHHLATAFSFMSRPDLDFLGQLPRAEFKQLREIVIEMVLATDLSQHFGLLASFKNKIAQAFDPKESREDKIILLKILMKCADVSNPTKEWPIYFEWADRVLEEFMRQGDKEKNLNLPVSPFMDRDNINIPSSQIGFMDYVLLPLFEAVNKYIEIPHILGNLQANREHWVKLRTSGVVHLANVISPTEMANREAASTPVPPTP